MDLQQIVAASTHLIEERHAAREHAISTARALVRQCANTIRATHRGEYDAARQMLTEAEQIVTQLRAGVESHPDLLHTGYTQDALKEFAEAALVYAFLRGEEPPSPSSLRVEPAAYLNGMAEAASELRRAILDKLRRGEVAQSEDLLNIMDEVYSLLITIDYPDAITGGLRRTTDALRAVLERTRGDMVTALRQDRLAALLAAFEERVK